jgi:hypothetical protein
MGEGSDNEEPPPEQVEAVVTRATPRADSAVREGVDDELQGQLLNHQA